MILTAEYLVYLSCNPPPHSECWAHVMLKLMLLSLGCCASVEHFTSQDAPWGHGDGPSSSSWIESQLIWTNLLKTIYKDSTHALLCRLLNSDWWLRWCINKWFVKGYCLKHFFVSWCLIYVSWYWYGVTLSSQFSFVLYSSLSFYVSVYVPALVLVLLVLFFFFPLCFTAFVGSPSWSLSLFSH